MKVLLQEGLDPFLISSAATDDIIVNVAERSFDCRGVVPPSWNIDHHNQKNSYDNIPHNTLMEYTTTKVLILCIRQKYDFVKFILEYVSEMRNQLLQYIKKRIVILDLDQNISIP